jgi:hypothetical protein
MVFSATFKDILVISWRSVLLVKEAGDNHDLSHHDITEILLKVALNTDP